MEKGSTHPKGFFVETMPQGKERMAPILKMQGYSGVNLTCKLCKKDAIILCHICQQYLCEGCAISH